MRGSSTRRRWRRVALAAVCGTGTFACVFAAAQGLVDGLAIATPELRIDLLGDFQRTLEALATRRDDAGTLDVLLFGDSSMYSPADGGTFEAQLAESLERHRGGAPVRTHRLAGPGLDAFSFYFTATRAAQTRPDAAVIAFNPTSLSARWARSFRAPALAALVPGAALPSAAALPGDWIGLSVDRLITYWVLLRTLGLERWRALDALQARVNEARRAVEQHLCGGSEYRLRLRVNAARIRAGAAPSDARGRARASAAGYRIRYAGALRGVTPEHPALRALAATIDVLRAHSIPTLVYGVPLNVEHMRKVGLSDQGAIDRTIAAVQLLTTSHGAFFVDLHAAFPDSEFRDEGDHLEFAGAHPAMRRLAAELAQLLERSLMQDSH